jgi:Fe-S-cluster containining protein
VTPEERKRIEGQGWAAEPDFQGVPLFVRAGGWFSSAYRLNHRADGACVFLGPDNRCRIHAKHGAAAKPLACRIYPYSLVPAGDHWKLGLRFACPSAVADTGRPLADHLPEAREFAAALEADATTAAITVPPPPLQKGQPVTWGDFFRITTAVSKMLAEEEETMERRWRKVFYVVDLLRKAKFDGGGDAKKAITGGRLSELLYVLGEAAEDEARRLFSAAHRVHVRLTSGDRTADEALLGRVAAIAAGSRAALLLEAGSAGGSIDAAVDLAVAASVAARRAGARLALAVDPSIGPSPLHSVRALASRLAESGLDVPIVLIDRPGDRGADPLLAPAAALGGLLCEGIGDSIQVTAGTAEESRRLAFNILQASRVRISKTDFISCPSCGRTLFDLEITTARIKARTSHLKGLKIAVMGCIVNGPGEMADADFGYVGWGEDKIALFVGKEMVAKDIPTEEADERLVELIKARGAWVDPPAETTS